MKLENQVCTLEQAKEFDELGLELETLWRWQDSESDKWELVSAEDCIDGDNSLPAYSCAELGAVLPYSIIDGHVAHILCVWKVHQQFSCAYEKCGENKKHLFDEIIDGEHEAHAKADLLIYLLEEKIINPKDLTLENI